MRRKGEFEKNIIGIILVFFLLDFCGCQKRPLPGIKVVATTTLIETIVKTIGKDKVSVVTIVPGGMCPGHFDIKHADIETLSKASILLNHGWEKWITNLINSVENKELVVKTISLEGNWMVPDVHIQAVDEITKILCKVDSQNTRCYQESSNSYKEAINLEVVRIQELMRNFEGTKVICAKHQSGFFTWLGFKVVAIYGRAEEMTPKELVKIIKTASEEGVQIVVDNLQSGATAGVQIAEEIGARHIVLTNFPIKGSYIASLKENINKIIIR